MNTVEFVIATRDPKLLEETINSLPNVSCSMVAGTFDGAKCTLRVFGDVDFVRHAIIQQGYGEILGEQQVEVDPEPPWGAGEWWESSP